MYQAPRPGPMGRSVLLLVRLTSVFVVLAVVGLLVPSLLLFYPNPPSVTIPLSGQGFSSRFDPATNTLHLDGNVTMAIEGVYDVGDAVMEISVRNRTGMELVNRTQGPFTLTPKRPHTEHVDLAVDLGNWAAQGGNPLFVADDLALRLALRADYVAGYVRVEGVLRTTMPWVPPVRQLRLDANNATARPNGGNVTWSLPYTVDTAPYLQGTASVEVTLRNATGVVASNTTTVPLGTVATGKVTMTMANATAVANDGATLTLVTRVTLPGGLSFTTSRQILWRNR